MPRARSGSRPERDPERGTEHGVEQDPPGTWNTSGTGAWMRDLETGLPSGCGDGSNGANRAEHLAEVDGARRARKNPMGEAETGHREAGRSHQASFVGFFVLKGGGLLFGGGYPLVGWSGSHVGCGRRWPVSEWAAAAWWPVV